MKTRSPRKSSQLLYSFTVPILFAGKGSEMTTLKTADHTRGTNRSGMWHWVSIMAVLLGAGASGCGPEDTLEALTLESQSQELDSMNGLSANGLSANGLSANGLSANGLSANGLSTSSFSTWFAQDAALADMVMRYVVRCAVPAGETRSYRDTRTGQTYTWNGGLGLAPDWANGAPATKAEQQVVSSCLMAHVNRYELSISISVLGRDAKGKMIPYTTTELETYSVREACFFGNLFTQEGLYFGVDRPITDESQYLTRACAGLEGSSCAPLTYVGACSQVCSADKAGPFYKSCTRNGVTYLALTTRMRQSDYNQLFSDTNTTGLPSEEKDNDSDAGLRKQKDPKK